MFVILRLHLSLIALYHPERLLGLSWRILGAVLRSEGFLLHHLGALLGSLGPSWLLLEATFALLGSLLASSGLSCDPLDVPSLNFETPMTI